jgi:hypothetical protein
MIIRADRPLTCLWKTLKPKRNDWRREWLRGFEEEMTPVKVSAQIVQAIR